MTETVSDDTPVAARRSGSTRAGLVSVLGAFVIWGLLPLYLHALGAVPTLQIMAHRILWSCVLVFGWLALRGGLGSVRSALADPPSRRRLTASAALVSINWVVYVWAVNSGHVVEASLGYFINPLLSVALGVVVLQERLDRAQWVAVGLAAAGVAYLSLATGRPPWIALVLAASFAGYGFIRKVVAVESVPGLATETLLLAPLAVGWLLWCEHEGSGAFGHAGAPINLLLLGCGIVTALPLALFAFGARLIPLSSVGLLQYVGPTLQFLIGVLVLHEAFPRARAVGFAMIWSALAIYAADSLWRNRKLLRA
ncbi:MAG TPA: EamA family transporter RarD [Steroidobacteraceae bacterium]|nr:EamA family transporter RarD [Steroidobacteraceae bacterium]